MNSAGFAGVRSALIAVFSGLILFAASSAAWAAAPATEDAPADPAIRSGTLANGLGFIILRHAAATHEVSLRLRIAAGSLQEPLELNGVAHVLEHMAFRGSTHVPETEIWRDLSRLGVAFGADSNAYTATSQTYFQFDLPEGGEASIGTGLMLMREIAGELTLKQAAVNDERNVVLAEARLTDSPAAQADRAQTAFWFESAPRAARDAMGDIDVIGQIQAAPLRAFYDQYYRPERATVIVVGDIDPPAVEAQIRARFADWAGRGPPGDDPPVAAPAPEGPRASLFVQRGAPASVRLAWIAPRDPAPKSLAAERRRLLAELAIGVLNRRLNGQGGAYFAVTASRQAHPPIGEVTLISADYPPGQWRAALASVEIARRQLLAYGVQAPEVEAEAAEALRAAQVAAAAAETRPSAALANALVGRLEDGRPLTGPAQDLALAEAVYRGVQPAEVDAAMRALFAGAGPLAFVSSPEPIRPGEAGVRQALVDSDAAPVDEPVREAQPPPPAWPYASFGPAGVVAERREVPDLSTTFVRFRNGVRLTVRPSTLDTGQVLVQVAVGGGRLDLPTGRMTVDWAADSGVIDGGGLKAIDRGDMRRALAASTYTFSFQTGDDGFDFSGVTRPADLDVQLQVLAAYATDPGWRPGAFEHVRGLFAALLPQFEASPGGVLGDYVGGLLHDGDRRWSTPTMGDVATARARDLRALLERPLATGAIDMTIVGDVSVERAIQAVAATFGALPPRTPRPASPPEAYRTRFPAPTPTPVVRYHGGHADQALALTAWPAGDAYAVAPSLADMRVLQQVLNNRLIERLRIADGATYTPRTGLEASRTFAGYGYLFAAASVAPAQTQLVFDRIGAIAADLRANPISDDELERARKPAMAMIQRAQQTDAYWLLALGRAQSDPRRLDLIRSALPALRAVTAADVQRAAQATLRDERAWRLVITPHGGAAP
ncbi:MAG TPA: insulinase family protein [Caulobacteraceae bacterium]|nr:insulinase family protein [Caulobacteraceae bacterium]